VVQFDNELGYSVFELIELSDVSVHSELLNYNYVTSIKYKIIEVNIISRLLQNISV